MKYVSRLLVSLAAIAGFASVACAATVGGPSPGLWYDPDESGRGYDIDVQGDTMIVSTYVYDAQHNPIWYLSAGTYDHETGIFTSTYDSFSGGQCFGCAYTAPTPHVGAGGPITITFTTNQTATITYPGGSSNIVKYAYGFPTRTDVLYGEWALSYETGGNVTGDWIVFDQTFTDPTGFVFVKGHAAGDTTVTALGIYDPTFREAQIEVTDGTTRRLYRYGIFDDRRLIGSATITVGSDSVGPYVSTGARLLYKTEVTGGLVIGSTADAAKAAASASSDDQAIRDRFSRARAALEATQP
ncbi:MAG: hypothetical protein ABW186_14165 [Rhodanobacteraceae bacterium]